MATNLSNIGTTLSTASPTQIASSTPPATSTATSPSPTPSPAPTQTPAPTSTPNAAPGAQPLNQDQLNALAKQNNFTGGAFSAVGLTPNNNQQVGDKYKAGYQNQTGDVPATSGDANSQIQDTTSKISQDQQQQNAGAEAASAVTEALKNNAGYQQLIADHAAQQTSQAQQQTLEQEYTKLSSELGLQGINTKLLNIQAIMDGNEQEIRNEITSSGGFATNAQVLAMSAARNQLLQQNYKSLLMQQQNAVSQINTMIGLSEKDRAIATQQASDQLNYDKQLMDYQDKMTTNAKSAYDEIIKTPGYGYKALYDSTGGDAHAVSLIENTLGLTHGTLAKLGSEAGKGNYEVVKGGTDAYGNNLPDSVFNKDTGKFVNGYSNSNTPVDSTNTQPQSSLSQGNQITSSGGYTGPVTKGLDFNQYGLLANTNINPKNQVDQLAQKYIDQYIKSQTVPTTVGGRKMTVGAMAEVATRAGELFYQATGHALPNTQQLKEFNKEISQNNSVLNKNAIQADTVIKNFDLAIKGEISNDVNKNATAINKILNPIYLALGDPAVNQAMVSNGTISQEFANLISIRNQGGTLASDKEMAAHLIQFGTSVEAQKAVVERLKQEASNIHDALNNRNKDLYKQVDPLVQDPNNPLRNQYALGSELDKQGIPYEDLKNQMYTAANRAANPGKQPAWDKVNHTPTFATLSEINSGNFIPI